MRLERITILALLVWAVIATSIAIYHHQQYVGTLSLLEELSVRVNIVISYGNNTVEWHNNTLLPAGASAFNATTKVAKVVSKYYPGLGEFVTSINRVEGNLTHYWSFWYLRDTKWVYSEVGSSMYLLREGDVIGWRYVKWGEESPPT